MSDWLSFQFSARLMKQRGGLAGHYLSVPVDIALAFAGEKVKRTIGTINGIGFNLALLSDGQGGKYLAVGGPLCRAARIVENSLVGVQIQPDPNPDFIELCEEMLAVLELDEEAGRIFFGFTKGMQRSLAYYANSAKQVETRIKRALELAHKMKTGQLHSQKAKAQKSKPED